MFSLALDNDGKLETDPHWVADTAIHFQSLILKSIKIVEDRIVDLIRANKLAQEYSPEFIIKFCCEMPEMKAVNSPVHIENGRISYWVSANEGVFATKIVCFWDVVSDQFVLTKIEGFHAKLGVFVIYRK